MNRFFAFLFNVIGYTILSVIALFLIVGPPVVSWWMARSKLADGERLRSLYVVDKTLAAGTKLRHSDIEHRFAYLHPDIKVLHASDIVGRFAASTITRGSIVTEEMARQRHKLSPAADAIIVQVRVKPEYIEAISPGARLAFIREQTIITKDDDGNELTETKAETVALPRCDSTPGKGLPVVAIVVAEGDPPEAALIDVALDQENSALATKLALHEWRPLVLGNKACQS